jgi:DNA-binding Xre family transcriptional regulator
MGLNIGLLIEQKLNERDMSKSELARRTGIANQNINRILEKSSIDTEKLVKISKALDYNFFQDYCDAEFPNSGSSQHNVSLSGRNNQVINNTSGRDSIINATTKDEYEERIKLLETIVREKERTIQILMQKEK